MISPVMMNEELVERLRARRCVNAYGQGTAFSDPLTDEAATLIEQLSNRVERLESGLKTVVHQFEKDFCIEGVIVDEAPTSFVIAWNEARAALTGEHQLPRDSDR